MGVRLLIVGVAVLAIATVTEFVGVEWWSSVDLTRLRQRYVIVRNGQLIVGTRGTAGFFNRGIPEAGFRRLWPRRYDDERWWLRITPRLFDMNQTRGVSIPMIGPGLALMAYGGYLRFTRPIRRANRCGECGYDLRGLAGAACPECGTLRDA